MTNPAYQHCNSCGAYSELHIHHIVPKSLGGSDNKGNLTSLCVFCHSIVHDVSFSGSSGLISKGAKRRKQKYSDSGLFIQENQDLVGSVLDEILCKDKVKYNLIMSLIECGIMQSAEIHDLVVNGKVELRVKRTITA